MRNTIMTVSTAGSKISIDNDNVDEYEGHDIVKISSKPFSSLPLFLPKYLDYDPETNMVSKISTINNLTKKELQEGEDEESEQSNRNCRQNVIYDEIGSVFFGCRGTIEGDYRRAWRV